MNPRLASPAPRADARNRDGSSLSNPERGTPIRVKGSVAMSSAPVLQVEQLTKQYPKLLALDHVSLTIPAGEIFALLGPNGAGKTTLIGCVAGTAKKTGGKISLFGIDTDVDPLTPRYDVGLVPQEINFDPFFTVREALRIQQG